MTASAPDIVTTVGGGRWVRTTTETRDGDALYSLDHADAPDYLLPSLGELYEIGVISTSSEEAGR